MKCLFDDPKLLLHGSHLAYKWMPCIARCRTPVRSSIHSCSLLCTPRVVIGRGESWIPVLIGGFDGRGSGCGPVPRCGRRFLGIAYPYVSFSCKIRQNVSKKTWTCTYDWYLRHDARGEGGGGRGRGGGKVWFVIPS